MGRYSRNINKKMGRYRNKQLKNWEDTVETIANKKMGRQQNYL